MQILTAKSKIEGMRTEANNHQTQMEDVVKNLTKSEGLDSSMVEETAQETEQKATMMETYLGEDPDSLEALEFLCLAEAGELNHYEVLNAMTKGIKNKQVTSTINSILEEEQNIYFCAPNWPRKLLLQQNRSLLSY